MGHRRVRTRVRSALDGHWLGNTYWHGVGVQKIPSDLWVYQEIICETNPDLVVETGTMHGGSALFFAHVFDRLGAGREDSDINGHPINAGFGPGPWEALAEFLPDARYEVDRSREKFLHTRNPGGFLRRRASV